MGKKKLAYIVFGVVAAALVIGLVAGIWAFSHADRPTSAPEQKQPAKGQETTRNESCRELSQELAELTKDVVFDDSDKGKKYQQAAEAALSIKCRDAESALKLGSAIEKVITAKMDFLNITEDDLKKANNGVSPTTRQERIKALEKAIEASENAKRSIGGKQPEDQDLGSKIKLPGKPEPKPLPKPLPKPPPIKLPDPLPKPEPKGNP